MRAIKIDPETRTIEEIDTDASLDSMKALLKDGPCSVRISQDDILWVGDNGLLTPGLAVFRLVNYPHPLAGVGLVIGIDEMGENVPAKFPIRSLEAVVIWTDLETTGSLTPARDYVREDGTAVHHIGDGVPRERK